MSREDKIKVIQLLWPAGTIFLLHVDCPSSVIRPPNVSSVFSLISSQSINCHFDRLLHFCPPGTFDKNEFLLWSNIFLDKYFHIEG